MTSFDETNVEVGMLEWFGDSTKEGDRGNYGYIKRVEKPDSQNIKVHWKGLICPVEEIKGYKGKGVLVVLSQYKNLESFCYFKIFLS